jgi:hypothetical protein
MRKPKAAPPRPSFSIVEKTVGGFAGGIFATNKSSKGGLYV